MAIRSVDDPDDIILQLLEIMINLPLQSDITPERWIQIVSVCLAKKAGIPRTDKIRIIHLYEGDLNLILKIL
jgi:hypothetical protein